MSTAKQPHANWVSPYITVVDADKAADFYRKAFKFEILHLAAGDDGSTWHDVDSLYEAALKAGAKSLGAPENMFWGDRMCRLQDLDGYIWCFATAIRK